MEESGQGNPSCYKQNTMRSLAYKSNDMNHHLFQGHSFAGLQNGGECWCGPSYNKYGPSAACTTKCSGDYRESEEAVCGGLWANTVLTTGLGNDI